MENNVVEYDFADTVAFVTGSIGGHLHAPAYAEHGADVVATDIRGPR